MAIEDLRPNNTDRSEPSQLSVVPTDTMGWPGYEGDTDPLLPLRVGPSERPLKRWALTFLSVRPALLRLRLFRSFAPFAASKETPQPREAVDPGPGHRPTLGAMERSRADTQRARANAETVKVKFPVRQTHSIWVLPIACPA